VSKPFVSRDRRIALGELKNMAGFVMDELPASLGTRFIAGIALRMKAIIDGETTAYIATDKDIAEMLRAAEVIERKMVARANNKDTAYADTKAKGAG
jgi:hypothetical protein